MAQGTPNKRKNTIDRHYIQNVTAGKFYTVF